MLEQIARVMNSLPPVQSRKNLWLALVLGFFFSGVGLGLYFRSWVDFIVPTAIWVVLIVTPGDAGFWIGAVIGGLWGLLRAVNSNERLGATRAQ
jgi:hypothetical protein